MIAVTLEPGFAGWRDKARSLLRANVPPDQVFWGGGPQAGLFAECLPDGDTKVHVPRVFLKIAETVAHYRDDRKWPLLYKMLYRITHGEPHLLEIEVDTDVRELFRMKKQVTHDMHQMTAFVRFRDAGDSFVAWYEPDHLIVEAMGPWFARRFGSMRWSILTPDRCAYWDTNELRFGPGVTRSAAPEGDALEELWRTYYSSIFNPARVNVDLLRQHMPTRRWNNLPEAELIQGLARDAGQRERGMIGKQSASAAPFIPVDADLKMLSKAVQDCQGCDLYACASQAVFGEGPPAAPIVFVGEQPGDKEDREGRPFVGPAGKLFETALSDAGLDRADVYLTNAVKHFRYEERGKARIHKTASRAQVAACQPWIEAELAIIRPKVIVCVGNTAVLSVVGRGVKLMEERGTVNPHRSAEGVLITVHPSFLLRMPDEERKASEYSQFVNDIRTARSFAESQRTPPLPYRLDMASRAK